MVFEASWHAGERKHEQYYHDSKRHEQRPAERLFHATQQGSARPPGTGRVQEGEELSEHDQEDRRRPKGHQHPLEDHRSSSAELVVIRIRTTLGGVSEGGEAPGAPSGPRDRAS